MLSVIRELAEEAEARAVRGRASRSCSSTSSGGARKRSRGRRSSCRCCATRASSTRAAPGSSSSCAASPRSHRRAAPGALPATAEVWFEAIHQELSRYRYCTVFLIEGKGLEREALEAELEQLGDSLLVVGDESAIKVHVHTDDPARRSSVGTRSGRSAASRSPTCTSRPGTRRAAPRRRARGAAAQCGVVAVVAGDGNPRCSKALPNVGPIGIVEGGQTMNPSTADLLRAVQSLDAAEALILPNNSNIVLAAEHAAAHADRTVEVVHAARSPPGSRRWSRSTVRSAAEKRWRCARRSQRSRPAR